jgi:hypothetical protein
MLLFGSSTGYIFAVMQIYWSMFPDLAITRHHPRMQREVEPEYLPARLLLRARLAQKVG